MLIGLSRCLGDTYTRTERKHLSPDAVVDLDAIACLPGAATCRTFSGVLDRFAGRDRCRRVHLCGNGIGDLPRQVLATDLPRIDHDEDLRAARAAVTSAAGFVDAVGR